MNKSVFVRARIEPEIKKEAEEILYELGITPSQAVTMLYKYIARKHEWPIELKIPNAKTIKTFKETDKDIGLIKCRNTDEMYKKLGI
ncbi:type II toxin-antitoxin system RelB/DinJ family antitoxin [Candidatus Tisiphia endosymbiont of Ditula angustiorana]|uniref:type II toxin-antitoxin system RelB/DinJ family antitoxin n=1 Tax=Candidatus Tisiphia endosymbiont of Ditula angustiorana TaxID=3066272 RepID=UPI00312C9B8D